MTEVDLVNTLRKVLAWNIDGAGRFLLGQFGLIFQLSAVTAELTNCELAFSNGKLIKIEDISNTFRSTLAANVRWNLTLQMLGDFMWSPQSQYHITGSVVNYGISNTVMLGIPWSTTQTAVCQQKVMEK